MKKILIFIIIFILFFNIIEVNAQTSCPDKEYFVNGICLTDNNYSIISNPDIPDGHYSYSTFYTDLIIYSAIRVPYNPNDFINPVLGLFNFNKYKLVLDYVYLQPRTDTQATLYVKMHVAFDPNGSLDNPKLIVILPNTGYLITAMVTHIDNMDIYKYAMPNEE
jgi:hypothetical protein